MTATPSNYSHDYDSLNGASYDPRFTANISNQMQVPDSIHLAGHSKSPLHDSGSTRANMKVPDRILLAGDNQHIGAREEFRQHPLDLAGGQHYVGLSTPPRVLTIEDSLPATGAEEDDKLPSLPDRSLNSSLLNGLISMDTSHRSLTPPLPFTSDMTADDSLVVQGDDDDALLRRHVARLQRQMIHLQEENYRRSGREMILYPTLLLYFLFQIGKWFVSKN